MHSYCIVEVYVPLKLQCNIDMKYAHSWYIWTGITPDEYWFQDLLKNRCLYEEYPYNLRVLVAIIKTLCLLTVLYDTHYLLNVLAM